MQIIPGLLRKQYDFDDAPGKLLVLGSRRETWTLSVVNVAHSIDFLGPWTDLAALIVDAQIKPGWTPLPSNLFRSPPDRTPVGLTRYYALDINIIP